MKAKTKSKARQIMLMGAAAFLLLFASFYILTTVNVDNNPPSINSVSPASGSTVPAGETLLKAVFVDGTESSTHTISWVSSTFDGEEDVANVFPDHWSVTKKTVQPNPAEDVYYHSLTVTRSVDLGEGSHSFSVTAEDQAGNRATASSTFTVVSTADITGDVHIYDSGGGEVFDGDTVKGTIEVVFSVTAGTPKSVVLKVDGSTVSDMVKDGSDYAGSVDTTQYSDGSHSVTVDAVSQSDDVFTFSVLDFFTDNEDGGDGGGDGEGLNWTVVGVVFIFLGAAGFAVLKLRKKV